MRRLTLIYPAIGRKPGKPFVRSWQLQPLAIARLAAMTPPDWQITFIDDRLEPIDYGIATDLVALSIETYSSKRGFPDCRPIPSAWHSGGARWLSRDALPGGNQATRRCGVHR